MLNYIKSCTSWCISDYFLAFKVTFVLGNVNVWLFKNIGFLFSLNYLNSLERAADYEIGPSGVLIFELGVYRYRIWVRNKEGIRVRFLIYISSKFVSNVQPDKQWIQSISFFKPKKLKIRNTLIRVPPRDDLSPHKNHNYSRVRANDTCYITISIQIVTLPIIYILTNPQPAWKTCAGDHTCSVLTDYHFVWIIFFSVCHVKIW